MRMQDIKGMRDLRDLSNSDVADLLDELRAIATKRGTELLQQGRVQARRAMGSPDPGVIGWTFLSGIVAGAAVGAAVAMLMTPMPGREARERLAKQAGQVRERMPEMRIGLDGHTRHAPPEAEVPAESAGTTG